MLTLDGGPTRLTRAVDGVMFDANGDGRPDRVAWTRTGAGVAFLVVDLNGNGVIDNVTEMLGQAVWVELDPAPEDRTISVVSNLSGIGSIARAAQGGLLAAVRAGGQKSRPG